MRVLASVLQSTILILLIVVLVAVVARELLLFLGVQQVRGAVNEMDSLSRVSREYDTQCRQKGGRSSGGVNYLQLKFIDSRQYQLEVICDYFSSDPIVAEEYTLPPMVMKVPGESGLIWDKELRSGIALSVYGRKNTIILDQTELSVSLTLQPIEGTRPESVCQGFGYTCCDYGIEAGVGDSLAEALDCPLSCFAQCVPSPSVIKFNSDPTPDINTRQVTIGKNDAISFYYVVDPAGSDDFSVIVDFGDGTSEAYRQAENTLTHNYDCLQASCQFQANVQIFDTEGRSSVNTPISNIMVIVQ